MWGEAERCQGRDQGKEQTEQAPGLRGGFASKPEEAVHVEMRLLQLCQEAARELDGKEGLGRIAGSRTDLSIKRNLAGKRYC